MKVERTIRHEMPAHDVFQMICTPEFQERKCEDAGALTWSVDVHEDSDDRAVVKTTRKMPTHDFPALLRKFVPHGVSSTETITWSPAEADGSRSGHLHVAIHGVPARMNGTITLRAGESHTTISVDADFVAHIPLVKKKVESASVPIILQIIDIEVQTGQSWAAGVR